MGHFCGIKWYRDRYDPPHNFRRVFWSLMCWDPLRSYTRVLRVSKQWRRKSFVQENIRGLARIVESEDRKLDIFQFNEIVVNVRAQLSFVTITINIIILILIILIVRVPFNPYEQEKLVLYRYYYCSKQYFNFVSHPVFLFSKDM